MCDDFFYKNKENNPGFLVGNRGESLESVCQEDDLSVVRDYSGVVLLYNHEKACVLFPGQILKIAERIVGSCSGENDQYCICIYNSRSGKFIVNDKNSLAAEKLEFELEILGAVFGGAVSHQGHFLVGADFLDKTVDQRQIKGVQKMMYTLKLVGESSGCRLFPADKIPVLLIILKSEFLHKF